MKFTKMQGIGNDYVYVNCFQEKIAAPSDLAVRISDRHLGVGSDGLILICPSEIADFQMVMYNSDGSRAQMCGNGVRCVGPQPWSPPPSKENAPGDTRPQSP